MESIAELKVTATVAQLPLCRVGGPQAEYGRGDEDIKSWSSRNCRGVKLATRLHLPMLRMRGAKLRSPHTS
jgi:hypothetical protein